MPDSGENRDSLPFAPLNLFNFPHYLSDEEQAELVKWGTHATGLTDGSTAPTSLKELVFVEVAKGIRPPETRFQRLWLRYLQAVAMETKLSDAEGKARHQANLLYAAQPLLDELKELKRQANIQSDQIGYGREATESNSIMRDGESPLANPNSVTDSKPAWRKAWEERQAREDRYRNKAYFEKHEYSPHGFFTCSTCQGVGRHANGYWCQKCDGKGKVQR